MRIRLNCPNILKEVDMMFDVLLIMSGKYENDKT